MFRSVSRSSGILFASFDLSDQLRQIIASLKTEICNLDPNRFLNTSISDLVKYFVEKYSISTPSLDKEAWCCTEREASIPLQRGYGRGSLSVPGQRIEVEVPIIGDADYLYARASTFTMHPPSATIRGNTLVIGLNANSTTSETELRKEIDEILNSIDSHLKYISDDVVPFNALLGEKAHRYITDRREQLLANQKRAASLGIPLKKRDDAPKTYCIPDMRRKITPKPPHASDSPYEAEPIMSLEHYEHILSLIQNMAQVMERSPSAFSEMNEEDLRQHFLVQLNGQYECETSAETFNVSGKTDILLRYKGKNVFIAECKFWKGPKKFLAAIDQLLSYTSWRDTKTAILVFCRNVPMSKTLPKILEISKNHTNFKEHVDWPHESGFRFLFGHSNDANRELTITVLTFDVPH